MKGAFSLIVLFGLGIAAAQPLRVPPTGEERERFVALAHRMETAPLDQSLQADREWALKLLLPDGSTGHVCSAVLGGFLKQQYKYTSEILMQVMFSSAAFLMEHPGRASDIPAEYLAGVEGALKAYQAILKMDPDAKAKALDELLKKQRSGKLAGYVHEMSDKGCPK